VLLGYAREKSGEARKIREKTSLKNHIMGDCF